MAEKLAHLDGLRGLAALTVFIGHFLPHFLVCSTVFLSVLVNLFFFGRLFAVSVFFVLSGFVLTYAFFKTGKEETLASAAVRRYIRLLIPVTFLLIVLYLFIYPGFSGLADLHSISGLVSEAFWGVFVRGQFSFVPGMDSYTGILWTMSIEIIGSFLVFSFASLFGRLRNRWFFYLVAGMLFLNSYYIAFIIGMALADLYTSESASRAKITNPVILTILLCTGILMGTYPALPLHDPIYTAIGTAGDSAVKSLPFVSLSPFPANSIDSLVLLYIAGSALILLVLINSSFLQRILSAPVPVFLGKISFSLYLIHMLVINTFSFFLLSVLFDNQLTTGAGLVILLFTLPVLLVSSYLMYRYIDQPGVSLAKWTYNRFFKNPDTPERHDA